MNLVFRHPSGGCLYQGDFKDATNVVGLDKADVRAVVFAAYEKNAPLPDRFDVLRARLDDNFFPSQTQALDMHRCADKVWDILLIYLTNGFNVLSTCAMGLNRSGLMTGFTLVKLGIPPTRAITMIRRARGFTAMRNPAFQRLITRLGRVQGVVV